MYVGGDITISFSFIPSAFVTGLPNAYKIIDLIRGVNFLFFENIFIKYYNMLDNKLIYNLAWIYDTKYYCNEC